MGSREEGRQWPRNSDPQPPLGPAMGQATPGTCAKQQHAKPFCMPQKATSLSKALVAPWGKATRTTDGDGIP